MVINTGIAISTARIASSTNSPKRERASRLTRFDIAATVPQKALVAAGPSREPAGSFGLAERSPSIQVNGSVHWVLVLGPVGPVL